MSIEKMYFNEFQKFQKAVIEMFSKAWLPLNAFLGVKRNIPVLRLTTVKP